MKVAHFITKLANGGAEKMVVELANEQSKQGHQVSIVVFEELDARMLHANSILPNVRVVFIRRRFLFDFFTAILSVRFLLRSNIDIVHSHKPSSLIHLLLSIFLLKRKKFFHTVHNELSYYSSLYNKLSKLVFFKERIKNICLTENITHDYELAFPQMQFFTIGNGISELKKSTDFNKVERFYKTFKDEKRLLFVGRNSYQKNLALLFETMKELLNDKIILVCLGIAEEEIASQYDVEEILNKNIFILGAKENVGDYMSFSDALVLSSRNEGMPLVIIEAMSMSKPIISTTVGGIKDMIKDGVNGFLSDTIEKNSFVKTLRRFIGSKVKDIEMIEINNRKEFEGKYSIELCSQKHLNLYEA